MQSLVSFYSTCGNILLAGDYNGKIQTDHINSNVSGCLFKTRLLTEFINVNNLTATNMLSLSSGPKYSFIPTKAMIDYIFVESTMVSNVSKAYIVNKQEILTSDHLPVFLQVSFDDIVVNMHCEKTTIAWNKCSPDHIADYQNRIASILQPYETCHESVDVLNDIIVNALHAAENKLPKSKFNRHTKPYWTNEIKVQHSESRRLRRIWISEGRPRGMNHLSYRNYKKSEK